MGFIDRFLGLSNVDSSGKTLTQAQRMSQYYTGFARMSGYSWAIAIISGGVAYAFWKFFTPKPDQVRFS
jgi:hypothetical protein